MEKTGKEPKPELVQFPSKFNSVMEDILDVIVPLIKRGEVVDNIDVSIELDPDDSVDQNYVRDILRARLGEKRLALPRVTSQGVMLRVESLDLIFASESPPQAKELKLRVSANSFDPNLN